MANRRKTRVFFASKLRAEAARPRGAGRLATVLLLATLAGCSLLKRDGYDVPKVSLPDKYKNAAPANKAGGADAAAALPADAQDTSLVEWWRSFGNRELEGLINRGLANNPDVRIATLRLAQAKVRAEQAAAGKLPTLTAPGLMANQAPGGSTVGAAPSGSATGTGSGSQRTYQASIKGEWRLDVWGEQSALTESADLQLWRAAFERDNVQAGMVANLASNYVDYVSLNDRLRVAKETEAVLTASLDAIQKRVEAGDATITDMEQQRAAIFAVRATIPSLEQQRDDAINAIAFLVGTVPGRLSLSDAGLDSLLLPSVVPGLPSALLLRRPDVRMVEARLLSADADIDVARARILPPVDLSAQVGYSSLFLTQLFVPKALFWNALASLSANIFDGGRRQGEKAYSEAVHEEMVETYVRTIYQAMREVETALATVRLAGKRLDAQQEATISARRAWEISTEVYAAGGVDYLMLLDTERTYHRYLDEYQRIQMDFYRGYISLFHALGGGVKTAEGVPGKGLRPVLSPGGRLLASTGGPAAKPVPTPAPPVTVDGVNWSSDGYMQIEEFWRVELPGLYHRTTIGAVWRDLRTRFPKLMKDRILRPRLAGKIEDSSDGQESWYRLSVAKFASVEAAEEFCVALQTGQQRCRILSSRSEEPVPPSKKALAAMERETPADAKAPPVEAMPEVAKADPVDLSRQARATSPQPAGDARPATPPANGPRDKVAYTVQLGAFSNLENAAISRAFWRQKGYEVYISENRDAAGRQWYAVRTGVFAQRRGGSELAQAIRQKEDVPAVLLPTVVDRAGAPAMLDVPEPPASDPVLAAPVVPEPPERPLPPVAEVARASGAEVAASGYAVQLGAFSTLENARTSYDFWGGKGIAAYLSEIRDADGRKWFAVRTGVFSARREASALALSLGRSEGMPAAVVPIVLGKDGQPETIKVDRRSPVEPPAKDAAMAAGKPAVAPGKPGKAAKAAFAVQLGAFSNLENAAKELALWQGKGYEVYLTRYPAAPGKLLYALRSGDFPQRRQADLVARSLGRRESVTAMTVPVVLAADGSPARIDVSQLPGSEH